MVNKIGVVKGQNKLSGTQGKFVMNRNNPPGGLTDRSLGNAFGNTVGGRGITPPTRNFDNAIQVENMLNRELEKDPYMQLYDAYQSQLQSNAVAQREYLEKMYGETADILNKNYDKSANNAYINYRQSQQKLPEQLSNLGITGGASESANLKLQSAYGTNLANNEFNRNNDIASARRDLSQGVNEIDSGLNSQLADAYANFGSQSIAYKEAQKEKAEEKEKLAAIAKKNNDTQSRMAARQKQGYDVTTWTDEDGYFHYRLVGNSKNEAKKKQAEIDKKNNDTQSRLAKRVRQGYDVYTWTDSSGLFHYRITGKKKLTSSSGGSSKKTGGSSGGGGSSSVPPVTKNSGGTSTKKKNTYNEYKVSQYVLQNAKKMLTNPEAVVKDIDKKKKSGEFTVKEANMIYLRIPKMKK